MPCSKLGCFLPTLGEWLTCSPRALRLERLRGVMERASCLSWSSILNNSHRWLSKLELKLKGYETFFSGLTSGASVLALGNEMLLVTVVPPVVLLCILFKAAGGYEGGKNVLNIKERKV